jgi:hypothetical protein
VAGGPDGEGIPVPAEGSREGMGENAAGITAAESSMRPAALGPGGSSLAECAGLAAEKFEITAVAT